MKNQSNSKSNAFSFSFLFFLFFSSFCLFSPIKLIELIDYSYLVYVCVCLRIALHLSTTPHLSLMNDFRFYKLRFQYAAITSKPKTKTISLFSLFNHLLFLLCVFVVCLVLFLRYYSNEVSLARAFHQTQCEFQHIKRRNCKSDNLAKLANMNKQC